MGLINFFRNYNAALRCNHLSKDRLLEVQKERFRRLLRHTVIYSEFYQELYSGIDIDNCRLQDLPIVTKSTMMNNFDHLITDSRLKLRNIKEWIGDKNNYGKLYLGEFLPIPTSGSSGEYALVIYDRQALDLIQASLFARHPLQVKRSVFNQTKILVSHLLGPKARIAVVAVPHGNFGGMVKTAPAFHRFIAKLKILSLFDPIEQIVETLNKFQPDCLISYSFFLAILAQEQLAGRLNSRFHRPHSSLAGGAEPMPEHVKGLAQQAWSIEVQDDYGAVECYFMAATCQKFANLHAMNDLCILEVVDGGYNPVPPGEYGEKVLVSNLANFAQPIIRYELDDIAGYADQSCECGLPFQTLLPIQGRKSDFLYFQKPHGGYERFHPYRLRVPLYYRTEIRQYQIFQTARNELTFLYVLQADVDGIEQHLRKILENALEQAGLESRINLKLKRVENILRDNRSGKFQIIKSLGAPINLDTELDTRTY